GPRIRCRRHRCPTHARRLGSWKGWPKGVPSRTSTRTTRDPCGTYARGLRHRAVEEESAPREVAAPLAQPLAAVSLCSTRRTNEGESSSAIEFDLCRGCGTAAPVAAA